MSKPKHDCECQQCEWTGFVDELEFTGLEDDGVCPECGGPVEIVGHEGDQGG